MEAIIKDLSFANSKEELEQIFIKYKITSIKDRTSILEQCMNVIKTHPIVDEQTNYDARVAKFLEGTWRII